MPGAGDFKACCRMHCSADPFCMMWCQVTSQVEWNLKENPKNKYFGRFPGLAARGVGYLLNEACCSCVPPYTFTQISIIIHLICPHPLPFYGGGGAITLMMKQHHLAKHPRPWVGWGGVGWYECECEVYVPAYWPIINMCLRFVNACYVCVCVYRY